MAPKGNGVQKIQ